MFEQKENDYVEYRFAEETHAPIPYKICEWAYVKCKSCNATIGAAKCKDLPGPKITCMDCWKLMV